MPSSRQLLKVLELWVDPRDQDLVLTKNLGEVGSDAQLNSTQKRWQVPELRAQVQDHTQKSRD